MVPVANRTMATRAPIHSSGHTTCAAAMATKTTSATSRTGWRCRRRCTPAVWSVAAGAPVSGRSSNRPFRSARVLAFMACPTRSSNSAWSRRPALKCSARRSVTACRSASETRMCWSEAGPVNQPRVQFWLYCADMMITPLVRCVLAVAVLQGLDDGTGDRLIAALIGDEQQAGQVERDARAADDGQDHEGDPDDG